MGIPLLLALINDLVILFLSHKNYQILHKPLTHMRTLPFTKLQYYDCIYKFSNNITSFNIYTKYTNILSSSHDVRDSSKTSKSYIWKLFFFKKN